MAKPRIFLGSSGEQAKLLQALTRGLEGVRVEPWTTSFNPGTTTIERLYEFANQVDFRLLCTLEMIGPTSAPGLACAPVRSSVSTTIGSSKLAFWGGAPAQELAGRQRGHTCNFASRK